MPTWWINPRVLRSTTSPFAKKSAASGSAIQKVEELRRLAQLYPYLNYPRMVEEAIADVAVVFGQGMNLYVYLRDPVGNESGDGRAGAARDDDGRHAGRRAGARH